MKFFKHILILFLTAGFFACSSTQTTATWSNPKSEPQSFQKVAVLGILGNMSTRQSFEYQIVEQLQKENVPAVAAMTMLPPKRKNVNVDQMIRRLHQQGVDAVMVVSLSDVNRQKQYVPGSTYVAPRTYYNRFGDYYVHTYRRVHTPGYVRRTTTYFLESTLYDLRNQELIWTSEAKSTDPNSLKSASKSYAKSIVKSLNKDEII